MSLSYLGAEVGEQLAVGAVVKSHDEGNRSVEEVKEGGREDGDVDVGPLKGKHKARNALSHQHQSLAVCNRWEVCTCLQQM